MVQEIRMSHGGLQSVNYRIIIGFQQNMNIQITLNSSKKRPFVPAVDITLEVQEKSFIRRLSVDTGFQTVVFFDDLHTNEW